jgi:hypothetical protein
MVHGDTKNAAGEHFRGTRHFVERVVGRKRGWRFFCVDFVGFDTKLSCPRDGSTADSAGYSGLPRFERKSDEKLERTKERAKLQFIFNIAYVLVTTSTTRTQRWPVTHVVPEPRLQTVQGQPIYGVLHRGCPRCLGLSLYVGMFVGARYVLSSVCDSI